MKPKKLPLKEFLEIYNKVPRLCVDLIIKTDEGIVLSKRNIEPSKGMWHIPGGTILLGEKINDTTKRVADEETGLKLKVEKILGTIEYLQSPPLPHTVTVVYLTTPVSGKLRGSKQGKNIRYFKSIPKNTIKEQEIFLKTNKLLK